MAEEQIKIPLRSVPGLLPNDALQEQLKQTQKGLNTGKGIIPPSSAADSIDRVIQGYVNAPVVAGTLANRTGGFATPTGDTDQFGRRAAYRGNLLKKGLQYEVFGSNLPSIHGALREFGELSPEESAAEGERRRKEAMQEVDQRKTMVQDFQKDIDRQRAEAGLPPLTIDDPEMQRESEALQAESVRRGEEQVKAAQIDPKQAAWLSAISTTTTAVAKTFTGGARGLVDFGEIMAALTTEGPDAKVGASVLREWIDGVDSYFDQVLPADEGRSKDMLTELAQGTGSMAGYLMGGAILKGMGLPRTVGTAFLGAMTMADQQVRDAENFEAGALKKLMAWTVGAGLGVTEAIPIDRMLFRLNETLPPGTVARMLHNTMATSAEEFIQEFSQSLGADIGARIIYDPAREIDPVKALEQGIVGGIVGGGTAIATTGVDALANVKQPSGAPPVEQQADQQAVLNVVTEFIDQGDAEINQIIKEVEQQEVVADASLQEAAEKAAEAQAMEVDAGVDRFQRAVDAVKTSAGVAGGEAFDRAARARAEAAAPVSERLEPADPGTGLPKTPEQVVEDVSTRLPATSLRTEVANEIADSLARPPVFQLPKVKARGGTVPAPNPETGKLVLTHRSLERRPTLDPAQQSTGPVRGAERGRLKDPVAPPRVYYGVESGAQPAMTERDYKRLSPDELAAVARLSERGVSVTDIEEALAWRYRQGAKQGGYTAESGLGTMEHAVEVDPGDLYNIVEDPLGLRQQAAQRAPEGDARLNLYERLILESGFKGYYSPSGEFGQTAVLFEPAKPLRVTDTRYGVPVEQIAQPQEFSNLTAEVLQKDGWGVITGTQEAQGDWTTPENVQNDKRLRSTLKNEGIKFQKVAGSYQGVDQGPNYLIFAPEAKIRELGKKFKQESVLTNKGLLYSDGKIVPATGWTMGDEARGQDGFTTLPTGESFSANLDFDNPVEPGFFQSADWSQIPVEASAGYRPSKSARNAEITRQAEIRARQDDLDVLGMVAPDRIEKLMTQVPGFAGVAPYLQADEAANLTKASAKKIVDLFSSFPSPEETAAVAMAGRAKKGWYKNSAAAILDIFGLEDAPRFAALLAALSPQTSVESNAVNALTTWANWLKAGRPTDKKAILKILGQSVQGSGGGASVLDAWKNNSVRALRAVDPMTVTLSGPKVSSFAANLRGATNEVTNDTWMANFALIEQTVFRGTGGGKDDLGQTIGKSPGYKAMTALVRSAAEAASQISGETWAPSEIQETVWSWTKALYEKADSLRTSAEALLDASGLTDADIANTPDFAVLFQQGIFRELLERAGYELGGPEQGGDGGSRGAERGGAAEAPEGAASAWLAYEQHLRSAARRLDDLRRQRSGGALEADEDAGPATERPLDVAPEDAAFLDEFFAQTSQGRNAFNAEQQRPDVGIPGQAQSDLYDVNFTKMSDSFIKLLGLTARRGRFTLRGGNIMGQYSRRQGVVRVRHHGDVSTLVHEGGHALQAEAAGALKTFIASNELKLTQVARDLYGGDTSTMPYDNKVAEGFAEFFRVFTLNKAYAQTHYPTLVTQFEAAMQTDAPELLRGLTVIGAQFDAYLKLPSTQVLANQIVSGRTPGAISTAVQEMKSPRWFHDFATRKIAEGVNRYVPLNSIIADVLNIGEKNVGVPLDIKAAEDPRVLIKMAANAGSRAMVEMTDGVLDYHSINPGSPSLRDALLRYHGLTPSDNLSQIDPVREREFGAYLMALRAVDEIRRYREGKISRMPTNDKEGDILQGIADFEAKYGADFIEAAKMVHAYGMALWKKTYDAGLMTKEQYAAGLDRQFYAPLQRDMSDRDVAMGDISGINGPGVGLGQSIVKRLKGSDRRVINPMDALMQKTFALERVIAENEVKKALAAMADKAGRVGALVERIPAQQLLGEQFSVEEVARQLTKDPSISDVEAQDLMNILEASIAEGNRIALFRSKQAAVKGENIVFFWEKGKLAALQIKDGQVGADVVNLLNGVGGEIMPLFSGLVSHSSSLFRASITSWPDFLIVNFIRDQMSSFILTRGYKPFWTGIKGLGDELRQTDWARQYNAAMGIMGGMNVAALHTTRVNRDIGSLRKKGYLARAFQDNPIKGLARVVEATETGSRIGVYKTGFDRAKADGLTDYEAAVEAAYIATDLMNYGQNGSRMLLARRTVPFLNAQLQGLYKLMKTLGGDEVRQRKGLRFVLTAYFKNINNLPLSRMEKAQLATGRAAWAKMAILGLLGTALALAYRDDEDYQEASEYLRTTGWVIPVGDRRIFWIPKPFELAVLSNFMERAIEHASGDAEAVNRFLRGIAMNLTPPSGPPMLQTWIELVANRDFFTGREIVPDYMQGLEPILQYNNYTSELAKDLGEATGMSPMKLDHIMSGFGASAYRDISTFYNQAMGDRPATGPEDWFITRRFFRDVTRGSVSSQDFWKEASMTDGRLRTAEVSYKKMIEQGRDQAAEEYLSDLDPETQAYALLNAHFKPEEKRLHPVYRMRSLATVVSGLRRELATDLGVENTLGDEPLMLSASEKRDVDQLLSNYMQRETRNTLVYMKTPGWADKAPLATQETLDEIAAVNPFIFEELQARIEKKKIYNAESVQESWPEVRDRLIQDREEADLSDIVSLAKVMQ